MKSIDEAIIMVESGGDDNAKGDLNIPQHAYGCMQIRQPVCDDVNAAYGTRLTAVQMLGRRSLSKAFFWLYMSLYCTSANLGRLPTDQDRARIWNGGPNGYKNPATYGYWNRVQAAMSG